jgi:UDPglucose--hexose-1-phosphate uridylyltransferase
MPELRKNPITGRWVNIAAEREKRPRQLDQTCQTARPEPCPFCAGSEARTPPEVMAYRDSASPPNLPGWTLRVVPNKYPALIDADGQILRQEPLCEAHHAIGAHEVIIESPEHIVNMGALGVEQITRILRAYRDRMRALQKDPRWRYILVYKNHGDRAGATLEHIHSQLIALPAMPEQAIVELSGARKYYDSTGRCIYCEMIEQELRKGERLILDGAQFMALCPFASRFSYETWILPKHHIAAFEQSSEKDISSLAYALRAIIAKLNHALDNPPFNYLIHSIPPQESKHDHYHWHVEILPQVARAAGFEWGTGMHINSVAPEDAARLLREAAL